MANGQMRSDSPHLAGGMAQQQPGGSQLQHRMSHLGPGQQLPQQRPPGGVPASLTPGMMPGRTGSPGTLGQVQRATHSLWQQGLSAAVPQQTLQLLPATNLYAA